MIVTKQRRRHNMGIVWKLKKIRIILIAFLIAVITACGVRQGSSEGSSGAASSTETCSTGLAPDSITPKTSQKSAEQETEGEKSSGGKTLTLMLYLCGSDLESKAGAASSDLDEILASGVNPEAVNIVVMAGGTTKWQNGFSDGETAVYALETGADGGPGWKKTRTFTSPEQEGAPADMGESETLQKFLEFSYTQYPAQRYALIMWDHGGGPMRGLCWDTAWAKDNLTMEEFTGALAASPFAKDKFSWIGFDACLMSSVETAHLVSPYADYMIASEETEPSLGWSYVFLKEIEKDADGATTGRRIVDSFFAAAEAENAKSALTLSCTDLSKVQAVELGLDGFFDVLSDSLDAETFSELSNLRQDTREFGKAMNDSQRTDLVDLGDLVSHYAEKAPAEAEKLKMALEETVVYNRSSLEGCTGLSAYHPYYNKTYFEKAWQKEYDSFQFAPSYTDYINDFAKIWMSDAMGDWSRMGGIQSAGTEQDVQYFSIQLTPEQMQYYASAELLILSQYGDEDRGFTYSEIYRTDDVKLDENGVLTAGYNQRSLYVFDDNGEVIDGPLSYTISDDGNYQIKGGYINRETGTEQELTRVMFECGNASPGTDLPILDRYVYDEETELWSNRIRIQPEEYKTLYFSWREKTVTSEQGRILPFSEWEDSDVYGMVEIDLPVPLHFRFIDRNLSGEELSAFFEIADTQCNLYGSELLPVGNPEVRTIYFQEGTTAESSPEFRNPGETTTIEEGGEVYVWQDDLLRITVTGRTGLIGRPDSLEMSVRVENLSDQIMTLSELGGYALSDSDRTCICFPNRFDISVYKLEPGKGETSNVYFEYGSLGGLSDVDRIRFVLEGKLEKPEQENDREDSSPQGEDDQEQTFSREISLYPVDLNLKETAAAGNHSAPGQKGTGHNDTENPASAEAGSAQQEAGDSAAIRERPQVLAEVSQGSLRWTLLSADRQRNGDLTLSVLCRNEGEQPVQVPVPEYIAVNGIVLEPYYPYHRDSFIDEVFVNLDPGTDLCLQISAHNQTAEFESFDHLSGSQHLVISDVLESGGVESARRISLLIPDWEVYQLKPPPDYWQTPAVEFELNKAIDLRKQMEDDPQTEKDRAAVADFEQRNTAEAEEKKDLKVLDSEAMTRALDAGGTAPVRTKLFTEGGITVYGEHLLIADRKVLTSMIIRNDSSRNKVLRFYNWSVNNDEETKPYVDYCYIAYAGTERRIYQSENYSDRAESDPVSELSFLVWIEPGSISSSPAVPSVYKVTISMAEGTAFNVEGGMSFSFAETDPAAECLTAEIGEESVFDPLVTCPENPEQYEMQVSFSLPDDMTEEERESVSGVSLLVLGEAEGDDDARALLAEIPLQNSKEQENVYTGAWSGLICALQEQPGCSIYVTEEKSGDGHMIYTKSGFISSHLLVPANYLLYTGDGVDYSFRISMDAGNDGAAAELYDYSVTKDVKIGITEEWPAGCFSSLYFGGWSYTLAADDSPGRIKLELRDRDVYIPTKGSRQKLALTPLKEFSPESILLIRVVSVVEKREGGMTMAAEYYPYPVGTPLPMDMELSTGGSSGN